MSDSMIFDLSRTCEVELLMKKGDEVIDSTSFDLSDIRQVSDLAWYIQDWETKTDDPGVPHTCALKFYPQT